MQPQPITTVATIKRATTATRVGKRLSMSEQTDVLRRMTESIERLEARVAKRLGHVNTGLGALKCRVRAIDESLQDELRDTEEDESMGMGDRHRVRLQEKLNNTAFAVQIEKEIVGDALGEIRAGSHRMGQLEEDSRLTVAEAVTSHR